MTSRLPPAIFSAMFKSAAFALALLFLAAACGDEGEPAPGYASPCASPMASVLECPAGSSLPFTTGAAAEEACERLVQCGILVAERLVGENKTHSLDYRWCLGRLLSPPADPCVNTRRFGPDHVQSAIDCIMSTPCVALGETFAQKLQSGDDAPQIDAYLCPDGETKRNTATVCDQGILNY